MQIIYKRKTMTVLTDIFKTKDALKNVNTNHIFAVDVSGSMYDSLPKMREHIKNNFALLVKPNDTVSIVYFSSKGEFGVVFENQTINDLKDLSTLQKNVDRFLKPMGLTGFKEPIQECIKVASRISNGNINNFIFMTDGYDNQWKEDDILNACAELPKYFANIVFIEYGYYCNRKLIEKMVSISNGFHVFSENYSDYEKSVDELLTNNLSNNITVDVQGELVFYFKDDELYTKDVVNNTITVPEDLDTLYVVNTLDVNSDFKKYDDKVKYSFLYLSISKMQTNNTWNILKALGDVNLIEKYTNCFSKQDYSDILKDIKECIFDSSKRFVSGVDYDLVPKEDAFTVIDLLSILSKEDNRLMIGNPLFNYSRIGAASKEVSKEDKIKALREELSNTTNISLIQEIAQKIADVEDSVKFTPDNLDAGVSINSVVYNESRPNISISTTLEGYVDIPSTKVKEFNLPEQFSTKITRSYTIVKDGIKNVKVLPVMLTEKTFNLLKANNLLKDTSYNESETYSIDISKIPLINRNMVKTVSAKQYFENCFALQRLKALQKVYKFKLDSMKESKTNTSFVDLYGEAGAQYLKDIGIESYGFSPKVKSEKIGDFYYSKELTVKISGLSSLPAVNATIKKQTEGKKINLADTLILEALEYCDEEISTEVVNPMDNNEVKAFLEKRTKEIISTVRSTQYDMNKVLYSIVVGQTWFSEFHDMDNTVMSFDYKGIAYTVTAILEEKEVKI